MDRIDLFLFAHKGLRHAMLDVAQQLGRCDFRDPIACAAAVDAARWTLGFLREHAAHEDELVFAMLRAVMPDLAAGLHSEHARVASQEERVDALLGVLATAGGGERVAVGRRLLGQWHTMVSHHLLHMEREEVEANRALQANYSDRQLDALHDQLFAGVPAARRAEWIGLIRPGLSAVDLESLERRIRATEVR